MSPFRAGRFPGRLGDALESNKSARGATFNHPVVGSGLGGDCARRPTGAQSLRALSATDRPTARERPFFESAPATAARAHLCRVDFCRRRAFPSPRLWHTGPRRGESRSMRDGLLPPRGPASRWAPVIELHLSAVQEPSQARGHSHASRSIARRALVEMHGRVVPVRQDRPMELARAADDPGGESLMPDDPGKRAARTAAATASKSTSSAIRRRRKTPDTSDRKGDPNRNPERTSRRSGVKASENAV